MSASSSEGALESREERQVFILHAGEVALIRRDGCKPGHESAKSQRKSQRKSAKVSE